MTTVAAVIPIYNDWEAARLLLSQLDAAVAEFVGELDVILVDDGSTEMLDGRLAEVRLNKIRRVTVLALRRNMGNQRAIAVGLCWLEVNRALDLVIVLDGDGEDDPADIPALIAECQRCDCQKIVFAARMKRSESLLFRMLYVAYRAFHVLLTGISVRVGNFSVVPKQSLHRLVVVSNLWNHYAASVFQSRIPYTLYPTTRAKRVSGSSRMNFVSLVSHGLSAISIFADRVGVRLLVGVACLIVLAAAALAGVLAIKFGTTLAIPGWATNAVGILLVLLSQLFLLALVFTFIVLANRDNSQMIPLRDYEYFVDGTIDVFRRGQ